MRHKEQREHRPAHKIHPAKVKANFYGQHHNTYGNDIPGLNLSDTMNLKLTDPLTDTTSTPGITSLNQEYKNQVESGAFSGSFSDFMNHLSVNGIVDTGYNLLQNVRNLFAKTAGQTITQPTVVESPVSSGIDMTKWIIGAGVAVVVIWGGVVLYKKWKGAK